MDRKQACVERRLDSITLAMKKDYSVTVILASKGYPGDYVKGIPIEIGQLPTDVNVFHAGTALKDGKVVTAGGRVLAVTAVGKTLEAAVKLAYEGVDCVKFEGMTFRKDIGYKCVLILLSATFLIVIPSGMETDSIRSAEHSSPTLLLNTPSPTPRQESRSTPVTSS